LADAVLPQVPLGKPIETQDIADANVFLASERAAIITGQIIKASAGHAFQLLFAAEGQR
jgi:enoyl-[acyl-carrier-protein] reductase (NADH)